MLDGFFSQQGTGQRPFPTRTGSLTGKGGTRELPVTSMEEVRSGSSALYKG